jgi:uncharacterized protein
MRKAIHYVALTLVVVGAVNWGLVGLAQFDLVAALFGGETASLSRIVYTLVGIAGVALAATTAAGLRDAGPALRHSQA